jgi:hypothetical protein
MNRKINLQDHTRLKEKVKMLEAEKTSLDKQKRALEADRIALQVCCVVFPFVYTQK